MYEMLCNYLRSNTIVCIDGENCYSPFVYVEDIIIHEKSGDKIKITFTFNTFKTNEKIVKEAEISLWDVLSYVNQRITNLKDEHRL